MSSLHTAEHHRVTTSRATPDAPRAMTSSTGGDILGRYLAEVRRHAILDAETERALALRYLNEGDAAAGRTLITSNLRLAVKIAFEYQRSWTSVLDLIQEGNVGLAQALDRYDPSRGIRFTSYAQYWIRAFILQYLMNNVSLVRIGSTRAGRKLFYKLQKEKRALLAEGLTPRTSLLAERLGVSESEIISVGARLSGADLSLDAPPPGDESRRTLQDTLGDPDGATPEDGVAFEESSGLLRQALEAFEESISDPREQVIWERRLASAEPLSLAELGDEFAVSKERVRQLEERLKARARVFLVNALGEEDVAAWFRID